jgi:hypothetical protein
MIRCPFLTAVNRQLMIITDNYCPCMTALLSKYYVLCRVSFEYYGTTFSLFADMAGPGGLRTL